MRYRFYLLIVLILIPLMTSCTRVVLELDKMSGAEYPVDKFFPTGASGDDYLSISRVFAAGGRAVAVEYGNDIPELGSADDCITIAELEGMVLANRDSGTNPFEYSCYGGGTCTDHPVYGVIVNRRYGGNSGDCQSSEVGLMGDPANRGVFFIFYPVISTSERNLFKATVHELGHTFNLHHQDARDGSIMTSPVTSISDSLFFSDVSLEHLQDHPENMMWPNTGSFSDYTQGHAQNHASQLTGPGSPILANVKLRLDLEIEPAKPVVGGALYIVVRLRNDGSEAVLVPPSLAPEFGTLEVEITRPDGTRFHYQPLVFVDSLDEAELLAAGEERTASVPIFFGAGGWSFDRPGAYSLQVRFQNQAIKAHAVESEPTPFTVIEGNTAALRLVNGDGPSKEAGKFLTWQGGDHLLAGIALLKDLVLDYPESVPADFARLALGLNASRDVLSFALGKVRRAECWTALHFLEGIEADRLPSDLRIRKNLAQARCLMSYGKAEQARSLIEDSDRMAAPREELRKLFEGLMTLYALPVYEDEPPNARELRHKDRDHE